jgi:hypothetical protein
MTRPVLHGSATQDSKGAAAATLRSDLAISQGRSGVFASTGAGATLRPAQRSPCYVVQDRCSSPHERTVADVLAEATPSGDEAT